MTISFQFVEDEGGWDEREGRVGEEGVKTNPCKFCYPIQLHSNPTSNCLLDATRHAYSLAWIDLRNNLNTVRAILFLLSTLLLLESRDAQQSTSLRRHDEWHTDRQTVSTAWCCVSLWTVTAGVALVTPQVARHRTTHGLTHKVEEMV
jgi:hypothetical protein